MALSKLGFAPFLICSTPKVTFPAKKLSQMVEKSVAKPNQEISVEIFKSPVVELSDKDRKFQKWKRRIFLKPRKHSIIFNSFKTIGFLATCGLAVNLLFFWDFGPRNHVFTNLRTRVGDFVKKKYFTLTDQEREYLREIDANQNQNPQ
jgi:hypothetical protein